MIMAKATITTCSSIKSLTVLGISLLLFREEIHRLLFFVFWFV